MSARPAIELIAVEGIGEIDRDEPLGSLVAGRAGLEDGDVVCISQKIVSKSEGRIVDLAGVEPSTRANELAAELGKDPALVEVVLAESRRVVRAQGSVLITETETGLICANAGVDSSNVEGETTVALLPADPDGSARRIRAELEREAGARVGVVISDSLGRPWRLGQSEVAIGCAGFDPLADWRGRTDSHGAELAATLIATADQIAAAADLARDKTARLPVVIVRGLGLAIGADGPGAGALLRPPGEDLFR